MSIRFEKVSFEQYFRDVQREYPDVVEEVVRNEWKNIKLPKRSTTGSAGYDFFAPSGCVFWADQEERFPTGIRVIMPEGWVLLLMPRSGHGFKYISRLANTIGVIDSDYQYSDNEGHIQAKILCDHDYSIEAGDAYMQGIFIQYGLTDDDNADGIRNGGFGSTDR